MINESGANELPRRMKWRNSGNIIEYLECFKHHRGLYTVFRVFVCIIYLLLNDRMGIDLMRR